MAQKTSCDCGWSKPLWRQLWPSPRSGYERKRKRLTGTSASRLHQKQIWVSSLGTTVSRDEAGETEWEEADKVLQQTLKQWRPFTFSMRNTSKKWDNLQACCNLSGWVEWKLGWEELIDRLICCRFITKCFKFPTNFFLSCLTTKMYSSAQNPNITEYLRQTVAALCSQARVSSSA